MCTIQLLEKAYFIEVISYYQQIQYEPTKREPTEHSAESCYQFAFVTSNLSHCGAEVCALTECTMPLPYCLCFSLFL